MLFQFISAVLFIKLAVSVSYDGYKVYEIIPKNIEDAIFLHGLSHKEGYENLHISKIPKTAARFMISPEHQEEFEHNLQNRSSQYKVIVPDVAAKLKNDGILRQMPRSRSDRLSFKQYYRISDINAYMKAIAYKHYEFVKVSSIGKSYEGRDLNVITISNGDRKTKKNVIFMDAGIHAREWIAPAAALYVIDQLVHNTSNGYLLNNFDWIILPVVNPDGYEFSHRYDRMWRKTRSQNPYCYGTDGNRNFDFHWSEIGSSSYPCSDIYQGPKAFSEPETRALRNQLLALKGRLKFYLTLHSYGKYILYPWGWTNDLPSTWKDLDKVAKAGASAIKENFKSQWTVGSSTNVLYAAAGGSDDYAFAVAGAPISITMELPPRDDSVGFDPSPIHIESIVKETWSGIRGMAEAVNKMFK